MSFLHQISVSIPSFDKDRPGKNVIYSLNISRASNNTNKNYTLEKTYPQFQTLKAMLEDLTNADSSKPTSCHCQEKCPFHTLNGFIRSCTFPQLKESSSMRIFLNRRRPQVIARREKYCNAEALEKRREALDSFIRILIGRFQDFSTSVCYGSYVQKCRVMTTLLSFFEQHQTNVVINPLQLCGWKSVFKKIKTIESVTENSTSGSNKDAVQMLLPPLSITSSSVSHSDVTLELLRSRLLEVYHDQFQAEFLPDLSNSRLWELSLLIACQNGVIGAARILLAREEAQLHYGFVNSKLSNDGTTALQLACRMGHEDIVLLLLQHGANVNLPNDAGVTPLITACRNGRDVVVKHLLEAGASVNVYSDRGTHPMHAAVVSQSLETVKLLVQYGGRGSKSVVNVLTTNGTSPIHFACKLGLVDICKVLLQNNVDLSVKTGNGNTALSIATENKHQGIVQLLVAYSAVVEKKRERIARSVVNKWKRQRNSLTKCNVVVTTKSDDLESLVKVLRPGKK